MEEVRQACAAPLLRRGDGDLAQLRGLRGVPVEPPKSKAHTPRSEKKPHKDPRKDITERLVAVLDDSGSMAGTKHEKGKLALLDIMPRIERTPAEVHFIRQRGQSTQVFSPSDDIVYNDIIDHWKCGHMTHLWEYLHGVLAGIASPKVEVVIVTDGYDNQSPGEFAGPDGFSHMMRELIKVGKKPRFRVFCTGNAECTGSGNLYYRDLALATGGSFVALDDRASDQEALACRAVCSRRQRTVRHTGGCGVGRAAALRSVGAQRRGNRLRMGKGPRRAWRCFPEEQGERNYALGTAP